MMALSLVIRDWSVSSGISRSLCPGIKNKQTEMDRHVEKSRGRDCLIEKENMPVMISVN